MSNSSPPHIPESACGFLLPAPLPPTETLWFTFIQACWRQTDDPRQEGQKASCALSFGDAAFQDFHNTLPQSAHLRLCQALWDQANISVQRSPKDQTTQSPPENPPGSGNGRGSFSFLSRSIKWGTRAAIFRYSAAANWCAMDGLEVCARFQRGAGFEPSHQHRMNE